MKITKISPAIKTPGRYNIFVDQKFSFSLDEMQLIAQKIKIGQEISDQKLTKLKNESDFGKNYIRALDLISRRSRSEKEIRDYGFKKKWSPENISRVIERLREKKYLNDERFAKSFVSSRANLKNWSRRRMELELAKKGISRDLIEKILSENQEFNEENALIKLIAKKRSHYGDDRRKFVNYLLRQGFAFDLVKKNLPDLNSENSETKNL